jgi:hypothetical protein
MSKDPCTNYFIPIGKLLNLCLQICHIYWVNYLCISAGYILLVFSKSHERQWITAFRIFSDFLYWNDNKIDFTCTLTPKATLGSCHFPSGHCVLLHNPILSFSLDTESNSPTYIRHASFLWHYCVVICNHKLGDTQNVYYVVGIHWLSLVSGCWFLLLSNKTQIWS